MEQLGYILIADITGYTAYLNESELEHAQGTLTELLELLIDHTNSPLIISRLEGDAVISYGLDDGFLSAQTFLETIETTYTDFRKAIELMVLNNTCRCNACANVSALDLKFFVHHGSFVVQHIGDHDELLGSDVNLIHRLLKNSVTDETGIRAYLLCTEAAVAALGLDAGDRMVRHTEDVPDFGKTSVWIADMQPLYEARTTDDRIEFAPEDVIGTLGVDIALPQAVVWDYLAEPGFRALLTDSDHQEVIDRTDGRVGVGSTYVCYHGDDVFPQAVLEWDPFDRLVLQQQIRGGADILMDYELQPIAGGTRLTNTAALGEVAKGRWAVKTMMKINGITRVRRWLAEFRDAIEADHANRPEAGPKVSLDPDSIAVTAAEAVAGWSAPAS